ncbi:uncharacterized protein LOC109820275 isoform X2 [Asparagus officinalis]|uniref:uncharacterized protein LOC109820275 isoform X2 n=1 Tax=Asparagus officinalis TaxID=4686 RepID=UPI00098E6DBB|nr:uncharacterized protein LOC109820275 isoform X2 [Asparagus officinalis]
MEKISAACAMNWSIELEKGLRSNNPARRLEAISQIGPRLNQWSKEPIVTFGVSSIYGLVPGEDRLFANTILLRLAEAFGSGDNATRRGIVKIFMAELKRILKEGRKYDGILSKERVPNYVEMIKRVKKAFDGGDLEAKVLALRLFGCWVDLAKDSVQIRYMILLSLQSLDVSEVKAALFAAGCFCRLSEDFACVVLEMLVGIITSEKISLDVKLGAIRIFARMRCSSSIAYKAYKAGKELMLCLQEDELKAEMLSSLSKLAFGSHNLIPQQVDVLLLSSGSHESPSLVRDRALKYLYMLFGGGACCFAIHGNVLTALIKILDEKELSPKFRCKVLQILHKVVCGILPDLPWIDMTDLFSLVLIVKNAAQSSLKAERILALYFLVDMVCILKKLIQAHLSSFPEKWEAMSLEFQRSSDDCQDRSTLLVRAAIQLIIDEMNSLMKPVMFGSGVALPEAKQEFRSLLKLILQLVLEYSSLAHVILDRLRFLIQTWASACTTVNTQIANFSGGLSQAECNAYKCEYLLEAHGPDNGKERSVSYELIPCICRFTISCLNILDETGALRSEVCHIVRSLLECIRKSGSCDACEMYSLDMHLDILFSSCWKTEKNMQHYEESKFCSGSGFSHNVYWVAQEKSALYFTKNMLRERKYWEAYRAGMYACQEGAWFAAAFTFRKLMDRVQSEFFRSWIRSLMLLAGAESEIKLILFPDVGIEMINRMHTKHDCEKAFGSVERGKECKRGDINLRASRGRFTKIHSRICSSEEILSASEATDGVYYFQRWFLSLRSKVLNIVTDMLRLFDSHAFNEKRLDKGLEGSMKTPFNLQALHAITSDFVNLSLKLNGIAKEYDLLAVSFLDIDHKSFRNISRQALSCSVLAFCTSFALFFLNSPAHKNALSSIQGDMVKISQTKVLKDLTERLWNLDEKSATELQKLMAIRREAVHNMQSRTESNNCVLIDRVALLVYKCCIAGTLDIQEDSKGVKDEEGLLRLCSKGIRMLSGIIERWIEVPCSIPKYFFRIRLPVVFKSLSPAEKFITSSS